MGSERILEDLLVLKAKILEVFEDLMMCENFSENQEEKLFESFNLLEESLSIILTVTSDIKTDPPVYKNPCSLVVKKETEGETHAEGTPEAPKASEHTQLGSESSSRKRLHSTSKESDQGQETDKTEAPAVKRRRGTKPSNQITSQEQSEQNRHSKTETRESGYVGVLDKDTEPSGVEPESGNTPPEVVQHINSDTVPCDSGARNTMVKTEVEEANTCSTAVNVDVTRKRKGRGRPRKETTDTGMEFKVVEPVGCKNCKKILCNSEEFVDHKCSAEEEPPTSDEPTYACDKCNVVFQTKEVMASHMANHKHKVTVSCRLCGKTFTFASHLKNHSHREKGSFKCSKCDEEFTHKKLLNHHLALHRANSKTTEPKTGASPITVPYKCPVCDVIIKDACNVKRHLDSHGEKNHVCAVCDKRFSRSDHLNDHMKIHSGHRPRICEFCAKGFLNSSDLKRHLRIHTGAKPYTCTVCKRGFTQKCSLNKHMPLHEKKPEHKAARSGEQQPRGAEQQPRGAEQQPKGADTYTYKHVMRDLDKTAEDTSQQEQQITCREGISPEDADQNNTNSETSTAPMKAGGTGSNPPQLITLLTKQPISGLLSTDRGHVAPSGGDLKQLQGPSGGDGSKVIRVDSDATRIILPEGVNMGQEILVYVEKPPATNNTQAKPGTEEPAV